MHIKHGINAMLPQTTNDIIRDLQIGVVVVPFWRFQSRPHGAQAHEIQTHPLEIKRKT